VGILDGTINKAASAATTAGVTLENNLISKVQDFAQQIMPMLTMEGQELLVNFQAQVSELAKTGEQLGEQLLVKAETEGTALIDYTKKTLLSLEFYCGFREKP
jgi:hypothetical protein